jgi:hypothetical protein
MSWYTVALSIVFVMTNKRSLAVAIISVLAVLALGAVAAHRRGVALVAEPPMEEAGRARGHRSEGGQRGAPRAMVSLPRSRLLLCRVSTQLMRK